MAPPSQYAIYVLNYIALGLQCRFFHSEPQTGEKPQSNKPENWQHQPTARPIEKLKKQQKKAETIFSSVNVRLQEAGTTK